METVSHPAANHEDQEFAAVLHDLSPQKQELLSYAIKAIVAGEDPDEVLTAMLTLAAKPN